MINSVRNTVHDFLEKNNRGWLKPERFNNYAYLAQMEILESYFYDYTRWLAMQSGRMVGSGYANIPKNIREKLDIFHKTGTLTYDTDRFSAPPDSYRVMDIFYNGDFIDEVSKRRQVLLNKSNLTAPSEDYPVYVREEDEFVIYPSTITDDVDVSYIRKPLTPKWTFNLVQGNPMFNQSANDYQDFEIHPSDEHRLIVKILGFAGVSIREQDVVSYAEAQEAQLKQNENRA
ncbi:virion structural protein [Maribacter phage Panino]